MALYNKYRPITLDQIIGNKAAIDSLQSVLSKPRNEIPHAFMLIGPSGCGKTTIARIIRKELGCSDMDYIEMDIGDVRGIDNIREIKRLMHLSPIDGKCRVWLMDEVQAMTSDAQTSLLKMLEDTPSHVYFILATTDPHKLKPTIRNRCSTYTVQALPDNRISKLITDVLTKEKKKISNEIIELIARDSLGSPRMALVLLDKVIDADPRVQAKAVEQAASEESATIDLCRALLAKISWSKVAEILKGMKEQEPESIRRCVLGYANNVLLSGDNPKAWLILDVFEKPTYDMGWPAITKGCYEICTGK